MEWNTHHEFFIEWLSWSCDMHGVGLLDVVVVDVLFVFMAD